MVEVVDECVVVGGGVWFWLTYQTAPASQYRIEEESKRGLTLVGVASGALVGLRTVVSFVETLVPSGDGNSHVVGEVPPEGRIQLCLTVMRPLSAAPARLANRRELTSAGSDQGTTAKSWLEHCYADLYQRPKHNWSP